MTFKESVSTCFNKYVTFSGRAQRSELWWFVVFVMAGSAVAGWLDTAIFGQNVMMVGDMSFAYTVGVLGTIFSLATLLPSIAVYVRRPHDLDKSGWWILIGIIPLVGIIILIVWFASKGTEGDNRFGPDPLA